MTSPIQLPDPARTSRLLKGAAALALIAAAIVGGNTAGVTPELLADFLGLFR